MGRRERREALAGYLRGLLLEGERKSMEPHRQARRRRRGADGGDAAAHPVGALDRELEWTRRVPAHREARRARSAEARRVRAGRHEFPEEGLQIGRGSVSDRVVVADAGDGDGDGDCGDFREQLEDRGLEYMLGITGTAVAWPPGVMPTPPPAKSTRRSVWPPSRWRDPENGTAQPMSEIAAAPCGRSGERSRGARELGAFDPAGSPPFAFAPRTAAHRERPERRAVAPLRVAATAAATSKLYISNLPAKTSLKRLVYLAKLRWRIERDYQEMTSSSARSRRRVRLARSAMDRAGTRGTLDHVAYLALTCTR
jgi:SRSO17 transposase